ncbi:hypothetical protein EG329_005187 [Mollisiaceae sp. DMI_Dod_QoI]|nr:hypothetical protein EG329_005187 [Helotiales sp. DMI_Dod_QoI]
MAPSRRKSCLECIKAKRRCVAASSKCQRCTTKELTCDYGRPDNLGNTEAEGTSSETVDAISRGPVRLAPAITETIDDIMAPIFEQDQHGTAFADLAWPMTAPDSWNRNDSSQLPNFASEDQLQWPPDFDVASVEGQINVTRPTFEPGDDYITTGAIYHERVRFAAHQFQSYPRIFYEHTQTPFIHRQSYMHQPPQVIQDALSACALYCGKNSENELFVFGDISRKVRNLIDLQLPIMLSPIDLLASTQALLLYQIIRLFDGDIRQRADAESDETTLISWTEELLTRVLRISPTIESLTMDTLTISSWNDWIFKESCRRTILTSYMLQGVYSFLKVGYDKVTGKVNKLSFTCQAALWNAPTEFHWKEALKDKDHFQVIVGEWDTVMAGVKPTDLEELGMMIMACYKGMEFTCEWLGKENLRRWDLE